MIYDSPPAVETLDAYVLASHCAAAVIVVRKNHTKFENLTMIKDNCA